MKYTLALSILVASSLMLFQNCGQVSFSDAQASGANLKLTTVDTPPSDDDSNSNTSNNNSSTTTNSETKPPTQTLPPVVKDDDDHKDTEHSKKDDDHKSSEPKKECSHKDDPKHKHVDGEEDDDDHEDDDNAVYGKCTVGPGKSKKLALVSEDDLDVQQAVGEDAAVCVTEKGCLEIASEKFGETSFKADIGFCKHGHHMKLNDKELQELVDKE